MKLKTYENIITDLLTTKNYREVARLHKITAYRVKQIATREGVNIEVKKGRKSFFDTKKLIAMVESGKSVNNIARELNISVNTIHQKIWRLKNGK